MPAVVRTSPPRVDAASVDYATFVRRYVERNRPVVLRGFLDEDWWGCGPERLAARLDGERGQRSRIGTVPAKYVAYNREVCGQQPIVVGLQSDPRRPPPLPSGE